MKYFRFCNDRKRNAFFNIRKTKAFLTQENITQDKNRLFFPQVKSYESLNYRYR